MRNCFVPGCDRRNKEYAKRAMFTVPKDPALFEQWLEALPKVRPLKVGDHVCLLHFRAHDIQKEFEHMIGGQRVVLERERKRLKPNAVPSQNIPNAEELLQLKSVKRGRQKPIAVDKCEKPTAPVLEVTYCQDEQEQSDKEQSEETADAGNPPEVPLADENEMGFNSLFDDVFEVQLPNTLWGVHRCPRRSIIMFVCMDAVQLCPTRMLTVTPNGQVKLFLASRLIETMNLSFAVQTIEVLSALLEQLESAQICVGADTNATCEVEVKKADKGPEDDTALCNTCQRDEQ